MAFDIEKQGIGSGSIEELKEQISGMNIGLSDLKKDTECLLEGQKELKSKEDQVLKLQRKMMGYLILEKNIKKYYISMTIFGLLGSLLSFILNQFVLGIVGLVIFITSVGALFSNKRYLKSD